MFKTSLTALLGTVVAGSAPLFDYEEPIYPQVQHLLSLRAQEPTELDTTIPCNYYWNDSWYMLSNMDLQMYVTDNSNSANSYAAFTFCKLLSDFEGDGGQISTTPITEFPTTDLYCPNTSDYDVYATYSGKSGSSSTCTALSTNSLSSIAISPWTDSSGVEQFGLLYSSATAGNSLQLNLVCDSSANGATIGPVTCTGTGEACTATFTGSEACASLDLSTIWDFFQENTWLWSTLLIVGGLFVCFFGRQLFKVTIFLATTLLVVAGILLIFYATFLKDTTESWVAWTVLACSILIGFVAGFFMMKLERVGAAILAGWGGFLLGAFINEVALYKVGSNALFWTVTIGCAVIAAILTFFIYNHVIIIMTAFAGGYLFWRGISLFAGGFPNEFTVAKEIQEGAIDSIDPWFYAYMVAIVITAGVGAWWQYKKLNEMSEEEKHPYSKLK